MSEAPWIIERGPDLKLRILIYQDEDDTLGAYIALALEMDLRGYGSTKDEALAHLRDLVETQISFALFKKDSSLILFPDDEEYFLLYEKGRLQIMLNFFSAQTSFSFLSITVPEKEKGGSVPISELGWTEEQAAEARARLSAFAPFWDDPSMDVYDLGAGTVTKEEQREKG